MSNDLALFNTDKLPAYLQGTDLGLTTELQAGIFAGGNRIGLKGSRFRLVVNGVEEGIIEDNYLDMIILGGAQAVSRVYYKDKYSANTNQPPSCYSADGVTPAADVKHPESDKCMTCPQNVKGSKVEGTNQFKACGYFRRVVVMLAGDTEARIVYKLDIKSQGLFGEGSSDGSKKSFNDLIKMIVTRGGQIERYVIRASFDVNSSVPKLLFQPVRFVTQEEYNAIAELVQSQEVTNLKTVNMATLDLSSEQPTSGDEPAQQEETQAEPPKKQTVQRAAPQTVTKQATQPVTKAAPQTVQKAAPAAQKPVQTVQRATPQTVQRTTMPPPTAPVEEPVEVDSADELADILNSLT